MVMVILERTDNGGKVDERRSEKIGEDACEISFEDLH